MGRTRNAKENFVGNPERKRPLGVSNSEWECNIKVNLKK
jgi:hypothetical protein